MSKLIDFRFWGGDFNTATSKFDCGNEEINQYRRSKCRDENFVFKEQNFSVFQVNTIGIDWNHQNKGFCTQLLLTAFQLALTINQFIPM